MAEEKERTQASWVINEEGIVTVTMPDKREKSFDIKKIFPEYLTATPVQKFIIFYGFKQKLSDTGARSKSETLDTDGKFAIMDSTFGDWEKGIVPERKKAQKIEKKMSLAEIKEYAEANGIPVDFAIGLVKKTGTIIIE